MTIDDGVIQSLETSISAESMAVIGLGNLDRADDGVGLALVSRLQVYLPERIFLETEHNVEALVLRLLDREDIQTILFIDATHFGGEPGHVRFFRVENSRQFFPVVSTHQVPLSLLMNMIVDHGKLPFLLGIQPKSVQLFGPMSLEVQETMNLLEKVIIEFLLKDQRKFS